jgi:hypothetical protein
VDDATGPGSLLRHALARSPTGRRRDRFLA